MQGPYRPPPPAQDPELARLAMEGQQRRLQAAAENQMVQRTQNGGYLSTAIGAYRGSTLKRVMLAAILVSAVVGAIGVGFNVLGQTMIGGMLLPGFVIAFITFMIWVFVPPLASQAAMAAEQSWVSAQPFQLSGYFEMLSAEPQSARSVTYTIRWQGGTRPPDPALLHGIFGAVDPNARVEHVDGNGAMIVGGAVSGQTGIRVNRVPVYRNHRLPAHVHAVVEQVLVALHRSHPIAEVSLWPRHG